MLVLDGVEVMAVREAASYAERTPETIRRWIWSGRLTARRDGRRLLVARADVDALLAPSGAERLTLQQWSRLLPAGHGPSAAELVLDDRSTRR